MSAPTFWIRDEVKEGEKRCAVTPENAKILMTEGFKIIVERSQSNINASQPQLGVLKITSTKRWDAPWWNQVLLLPFFLGVFPRVTTISFGFLLSCDSAADFSAHMLLDLIQPSSYLMELG